MSKRERSFYQIAILILLLILLKTYLGIIGANETISSLSLHKQEFKTKHLADSSVIYSQAKRETSLKEALSHEQTKNMALTIMKMKKPQEIVQIEWKTKLVYKEKLADPVVFDSSKYLLLPQPFGDTTKWYSLVGSIDTSGSLVIDSLYQNATFTYALGDTIRSGFFNKIFRKKDTVVRLHVDNPNIKITGLSNIYVVPRKKWYQSTAFKLAVGSAVGLIVAGIK